MTYLGNAFSINMIQNFPANISINKVKIETVKEMLHADFTSAIGHKDTAMIVGNLLGMEIEANRISISLTPNDVLIVAQYKGPRLPEGATQLPEGAKIEWFIVTVNGLTDISENESTQSPPAFGRGFIFLSFFG